MQRLESGIKDRYTSSSCAIAAASVAMALAVVHSIFGTLTGTRWSRHGWPDRGVGHVWGQVGRQAPYFVEPKLRVGRTALQLCRAAVRCRDRRSAVVSPSQRARRWLEKNFWLSGPRYDRAMPACDYPAALDRIIANFRTKEYRFWNSELRIVGIENIHETAELPGRRNPFRAASAAARP